MTSPNRTEQLEKWLSEDDIHVDEVGRAEWRTELKGRKDAVEEILKKVDMFKTLLYGKSLTNCEVKAIDVVNEVDRLIKEIKKIGGVE